MLVDRASLRVQLSKQQVEVIPFNNPTAVAVGALLKTLISGLAPDTILEAGGAPALVRLLKESTCSQTSVVTAVVIGALLSPEDTRRDRVADRFFEAGK